MFYSSAVQLELFEPAPLRDSSTLKAKSLNPRYRKPFIAMKSTKKLTIPRETRFKTMERSGRKQRRRDDVEE